VSEAMTTTTTITFDFDASAFSAFCLSPREFAQEMRIAAAVQWYAQEIVSQGKAAELAELTRAEFLEELHRRKVPACQVTADELANEIHGASPLGRQRLAADLAWQGRADPAAWRLGGRNCGTQSGDSRGQR